MFPFSQIMFQAQIDNLGAGIGNDFMPNSRPTCRVTAAMASIVAAFSKQPLPPRSCVWIQSSKPRTAPLFRVFSSVSGGTANQAKGRP
jgi:hypothetical protein